MVNRTNITPTGEQRELIALDAGCFLVIAPPGSGKTTVLTERVARLVEDPDQTFRVLALTFTNKAADNMKRRIFERVGEHSSRVTACTIHSFCLEALRNYGHEVGIEPNVSIYENEDDRVAALWRGLVDEGLYRENALVDEKALRRVLGAIGMMKRSLAPHEDAPETIEEGIAPLRVAYAAYDRALRQFGALDFDDILVFAFRLFSTAERVARQYRRMYHYVVVDEAQDTNSAQYEILRALCGTELRNVMLVADADQSIFRFAGATTRNLLRFEREFGAQRLGLSQNFRCAARIVAAANTLIAHNPSRITAGGEMASAVLATGHVAAASYPTEAAEAGAVLQLLDALLAKGLDPAWCYSGEATALLPEDICILGRTRYDLATVLDALEAEDRTFQFSAGRDGLFESETFAAFEALLRLLNNPADVLARRSLVAMGTGPAANGAGLDSLLARLSNESRQILSPLLALVDGAASLETAIDGVVRQARAAQFPNEEDGAVVLADAVALEKCWATFRRIHAAEGTPGRFLGELALAGRALLDGPGVRVLTIHAAKGLEFRAVVLVGMNEGSFPHYLSRGEEDIADDRRNAYVAITRAERALFISRPRRKVTPRGESKPQRPSRFLVEAKIEVTDYP